MACSEAAVTVLRRSPMPLRTLLNRWKSPRRSTDPDRRSRARRAEGLLALEALEGRRALAVTAPTIRLMVASDTGVKGDGITRLAQPAFAGFAPRGAYVAVYAQGDTLLGVARANLKPRYYKTPRGVIGLHRNAYYREADILALFRKR